MDLATKLTELQKRSAAHREVLLTEKVAKTALVMPFLTTNPFSPSQWTRSGSTTCARSKSSRKRACAILLDDNNRKTIARLHFNGLATKYLGTFAGKDETRHQIADLTEIYQHGGRIEARLKELEDRAAA